MQRKGFFGTLLVRLLLGREVALTKAGTTSGTVETATGRRRRWQPMRFKKSVNFILISLFLAVALFLANGYAQVTTATISGTVTDDTGAVIPGASVTSTNVNTGATRTVETDARGVYHLRQLQVGTYEVRAGTPGFQTAVRAGIQLTVGLEVNVNITLSVGAVTESVTITEEAPVVETTTSSLASLVDDRQIRDLPLNGRDYTQLIALQVGTSEVKRAGGGGGSINTGTGRRISVGGARVSSNVFLVDGTEVADVHRQTPGTIEGGAVGIEAIREFSLLTSGYSASYSSQGGAVMNAVSRSGTNEMHGTAFEFLRNSSFDANDFFLNSSNQEKPGFKRNQFGFSLGGPIKQDRTFYFGTMEFIRERKAQVSTGRVLDDNARQGILPGRDPIEIHPDIAPFIAIAPRANTAKNFGDGMAEFVTPFSQPINLAYWMTRLDHRFSDNDNVFGRYTFDHSTRSGPNSGINVAETSGRIRWQYATLEWNHIVSPTLINTARFGFTRSDSFNNTEALWEPLPSRFDFVPGVPFGPFSTVDFTRGLITGIGGRSSNPKHYTVNNFHYQDDVSSSRGAHQLKFGVVVKRFQTNITAPQRLGGSYRFPSLERFFRAEPDNYTGAQPGSSAVRSLRQWMASVYLEDSWQVTPNFTLNAGLRFEHSTVPTENHDRLTNFADVLDLEPTPGPYFKNADQWKNFQPRVGFAWDLAGDGRTAIRGGFGMFRQHLLSNIWFIPSVRQPPIYTLVDLRDPPFLGVFRTVDPALTKLGVQTFDFDMDHPYLLQYNLAIQRELMAGTSVSLAYAGSKGNDLLMNRTANTKFPTILADGRVCHNTSPGKPVNPNCPDGARSIRNPNTLWDSRQSSWAQSFYNSLQVKVARRFSQGMQMGVAYTWSRTVDEGVDRWDGIGNAGGTGGTQNPDDHKGDRGLSDFDSRHNFIFTYTYEFPTGDFDNAAARALINGWQMNGILKLQTGNPLSATLGYNAADSGAIRRNIRPDLKPGADNNPVLGGPDKYYDPSVFERQETGFYGNLARNTIIGPGFNNFDFALKKKFSLGEQRGVEFRAELFNLFNHPNFASPEDTIFTSATRSINSAAGRITDTVNSERQIQFGLKINF